MSRSILALAIAAVMTTTSAVAAESTDLSIYRSDNSSLFSAADRNSISAGYALVHETRQLDLKSGQQVVSLDGLPEQLDTEALNLTFPGRDDIHSLASRLLLSGQAGILDTHIGEKVVVHGDGSQQLASGTLIGTRNGLLIRTGDSKVTLVRNYAAVSMNHVDVHGGARLQETLESGKTGPATAKLDYPTGGVAWRAAYSGMLDDSGTHCRLDMRSDASIANRSGRDWDAATLKLIAGEPNFAKSSSPRPRMLAAMAESAPAPKSHPQQSAMGDYLSYTLDGAIDLPDGSITRVPLYASRSVDCQRSRLFEHGSAWSPSRPQLARDFNQGSNSEVSSHLKFTAFDNLPAGYLRVSGVFDGQRELLGEARVPDTPKGQDVNVTLGKAFNLRGERERTTFSLDKSARTLDETFRITLSNSGEHAQTVTVREHPNRWRSWTLVSSSSKPAKESPDTLDFQVEVPANGKAVLDYALRYQWSSDED